MLVNELVLPGGAVLSSEGCIRTLTFTESVADGEELAPGAACAACLEVELWAPAGAAAVVAAGDELVFRHHLPGDAAIQIGRFIAEKPVRASANVIRVTAYDRMILADVDFSTWLHGHQDSFPMPLNALAGVVCGLCGLELAAAALPRNGGYQVQAFYADGLSCRQILQWIAQAACCWCRCDAAGKLAWGWYTMRAASASLGPGDGGGVQAEVRLAGEVLRSKAAPPPLYRINLASKGYKQGGLTYTDYEVEVIDKVQIRQGEDDVGVIYPADETGTNALVIADNLLLTTATDAALRPVAQAIYTAMLPCIYTPATVKYADPDGALWGKLAPGCCYVIADAQGRQVVTVCMTRTISGAGVTLEGTGSRRRDSVSAVNSQTYKNLRGKVLRLSTSVDGLKIEAAELSGDYAKLQLTVDGFKTEVAKTYATGAQLTDVQNAAAQDATNKAGAALLSAQSSIEQSADGIKLEVSKTYATQTSLGGYTPKNTIRSTFALSSEAVDIESGQLRFKGGTITIDTDNFKLDVNGNVDAAGSFRSYDAAKTAKTEISNGVLSISRGTGGQWFSYLELHADLAYASILFPEYGSEIVGDSDGLRLYGTNQTIDLYASRGERKYGVTLGAVEDVISGQSVKRWTMTPQQSVQVSLGTPVRKWADVYGAHLYGDDLYSQNIYMFDTGSNGYRKAVWKWLPEASATCLCMEG